MAWPVHHSSLYEEQEQLIAELRENHWIKRFRAEKAARVKLEQQLKKADTEKKLFLDARDTFQEAEESALPTIARKIGDAKSAAKIIREAMLEANRIMYARRPPSPSQLLSEVRRVRSRADAWKKPNLNLLLLPTLFIGLLFLLSALERESLFLAGFTFLLFVFIGGMIYASGRRGAIREIASIFAPIWYAQKHWTELVEMDYEQKVAAAQKEYTTTIDKIQKRFGAEVAQALPRIQAFAKRAQEAAPPWNEPVWQVWTRENENPVARAFRLGTVVFQDVEPPIRMPILAPLPGHRSLLFKVADTGRDVVLSGIQSLLLQIIASLPPGKVRFTFIDPVGLGQSVAPFMHLADYDEQLVTARAWSESRHIDQRLAELTEHIENVIQKYLRQEYVSIEEYNEQAGEIAEPYRFLVIFDFPVNFSDDAFRRLISIVQNGPRCGVYAIIVADVGREMPSGFDLTPLELHALTVVERDGHLAQQDFPEISLEMDTPPELTLGTKEQPTLFGRIIKEVGIRAREGKTVRVSFSQMLDLLTEQMGMDQSQYAGLPEAVSATDASTWWRGKTSEQVVIPLGRTGARKVQCLRLSSKGTVVHALIVGRTGSGKSTLLHTLITSAAQLYSPEELEFYLVDFKQGVEFKIYATEGTALPHARVIAIESEREFGLSVLQGLEAEHQRRSELFRATTGRLGTRVENITEYREATGETLARILLVVDEFQVFFMEDDRIAAEAARILDFLVRQGRSSGIHILLSSQSLTGSYALPRSTIDQMAVRIALQCSEADSRLILADDNPAARLLSRPGEAIYNDANGLVEGNHPFQVAWLPDEERVEYLSNIHKLAQEQNYRPPRPMIVFEGNAPAQAEQNRLLADLLTASTWPQARRRFEAWLGEPIAIADPLAAPFRRQSGSNLLIVGQRDEQAAGMMLTALIGLATQHAPDESMGQPARFYVLDFGAVDAPYADQWVTWAQLVPHLVRVGRRRELPMFIQEIAEEIDRRLEEEATAFTGPEIYLVIFGLQRARDLRVEEELGFSFASSFDDTESTTLTPAQQFATILREGPDLGVHVLVWCDTVNNLNRTLDRRSQREFVMRCAFQMGPEDSAALLDTPLASRLTPYRALFYDEDEGRLIKFRPYGSPSGEWLQWVGEQLRARILGRVEQ